MSLILRLSGMGWRRFSTDSETEPRRFSSHIFFLPRIPGFQQTLSWCIARRFATQVPSPAPGHLLRSGIPCRGLAWQLSSYVPH